LTPKADIQPVKIRCSNSWIFSVGLWGPTTQPNLDQLQKSRPVKQKPKL